MRLVFLLLVLVLVLLMSATARGQGDEEPVRARVLCDGARVAAIQLDVPRAGVITVRIPRNVCGRSV